MKHVLPALVAAVLMLAGDDVHAQSESTAETCDRVYAQLADPATGKIEGQDVREVLGREFATGKLTYNKAEFMSACSASAKGSSGSGAGETGSTRDDIGK